MAVTILRSQPIFVTINCFIFLREKLSKIEIFSIVSAMFGVILITCPEILFGQSFHVEDPNDEKKQSKGSFYFGAFLAVTGAFVGSFVYVACRKLGKDVHPAMHPFYNGMITGFLGFWIMILCDYSIYEATLYDGFLFTICGLASWIQ